MIGNEEEKVNGKNYLEQKEKEDISLLEFLQKTLNEHIKHVRLSTSLGASPARMAGTEMDYDSQMERLSQIGGMGDRMQRRILELNPNHPIFFKMHARLEKNEHDAVLSVCAELLFGYALLVEGCPFGGAA